MGAGIFLIVMGLICILLPKAQGYKDNIEKHNYTEFEDFVQPIRNIIGWVCLVIGVIAILFVLFLLK